MPMQPNPTGIDPFAGWVVWLSGAMTGLPEDNKPLFHRVAQCLREAGLTVVNPAELDLPGENLSRYDFYRRDVRVMMEKGVNVIAVLDGHEQSWGVHRVELPLAVGLQMAVMPLRMLHDLVDRFRLILNAIPDPDEAPDTFAYLLKDQPAPAEQTTLDKGLPQ